MQDMILKIDMNNEDDSYCFPNKKYLKFMIDKTYEFEPSEPDASDYIWMLDRMIKFLVYELQSDDELQERFQEFLDKLSIQVKVDDFLNVE